MKAKSKIDGIVANQLNGEYSKRQQLFFSYSYMVLIDLTVLNLFNEYWDNVYIASFSISMLAALLLQILLQLTISIEHRVANYFKKKPGKRAKILRGLSTWGILFVSKLIILEAINLTFGSSVLFHGAVHGLITFIVVVIAIILAERLMQRLYQSLALLWPIELTAYTQ
jgi:hypothetical protein